MEPSGASSLGASQPTTRAASYTTASETNPRSLDQFTLMANRDGRFAPSPTGELHLGNLRTALLAWLFARSAGARFLVRIEDIDPDRVLEGMAERQLADLAAIGLDWDGEVVRQSQRFPRYEDALARLARTDLVYPCFCTRAEIRAAASAPNAAGYGPEGAYPGTCAQLASHTAKARAESGEPHCLRVRAAGATIAFTDRLLGRVSSLVDDFVVRRKDCVPAYNLAVVVDDAAQGIGEVVRGSDLADSTPRQLWLARALDLPEPTHAHVPLVLGADGSRLAKRHGSVTLADQVKLGRSAADVLSWLAASLSLAQPGERVDTRVLLARFRPEELPAADTVVSAQGPQVSAGAVDSV